jgi:hypothetical protein
MPGPIFSRLSPVRRRLQRLFSLRSLVAGLLVSSLAGVVLGMVRWLTGWQVSLSTAALVLTAGPVAGLLLGLAWRRTWREAAHAVDRRYELKDRSATALEFLRRREASPYHALQIDDAAQHLSAVDARQVVPLAWPRLLPYAAMLFAAAVALLTLPLGPQAVQAGPAEPLAGIVAEAQRIEEDLKQFEELARHEPNEELEKLIEELREKVEEMKQPGVDQREALAKLSEMQAAIQTQQAQYNVGLVDTQLQSLGAAMSLANALENAGKALVEGEFNKAAEELEKLEDPPLERKEAKAVEEKIKKVAGEMGEAGLGSLSEAASEMAEGTRGKSGKLKQGARTLAKEVSKHDRRKKIDQLLQCELDRLSECKCNCESNCLTTGLKPQKSLSPSSSFGMKTSGNVSGEKTDLAAGRKLEQITGQPGEGPSEIETSHSPEGRQQAARQFREDYQKYQRLNESVLDSEQIPMGHRQTIRRYFELIRPQQSESTD